MHSIYVYTDIYQRLKMFANSCIHVYISASLYVWFSHVGGNDVKTLGCGSVTKVSESSSFSSFPALFWTNQWKFTLSQDKTWTSSIFQPSCWSVVARVNFCLSIYAKYIPFTKLEMCVLLFSCVKLNTYSILNCRFTHSFVFVYIWGRD